MDKHLADAVLVLPPFYFSHVSDVGLEHFLQSILEEAELPVYLYNFPVHTNNMFSVDSYKVGPCRHAAMQKPLYVIDTSSSCNRRSEDYHFYIDRLQCSNAVGPESCECLSLHSAG